MSAGLMGLATAVGLSLLGADPGAKPWVNAPPEDRAKAQALRDQGNDELYGGLVNAAAEHYREALQYWDHPAIHFNYAQALSRQFKLLQCHEHLEAATRHGPEPLGDEKVARDAYKMLADVERELARLEITCGEPGARVTVDDEKEQVVCPRTVVKWMLPGTHVLSISKPGMYSRRKPVDLPRGEWFSVAYDIRTEAEMMRIKYPVPQWIPWTVLAVGGALAGAGGGSYWLASTKLKAYDDAILKCSASPSPTGFAGCPPDLSEQSAPLRSEGYAYQRLAWGLIGAGALATAAGVILLLGNQGESRLEDPDLDLRKVKVVPVLVPGTGGVSLSIAF